MNTKTKPDLFEAVMHRDVDRVRQLLSERAVLDERNDQLDTPLTLATVSDQFIIAEMFIKSGADIFAANEFGWTAGFAAGTSRLEPGTAEGDARQRVIALLKAKGFPWPAPDPDEVNALMKRGLWPPKR